MTVAPRLAFIAVALAFGLLQPTPPGFVQWSVADLEARNTALATRIGPDGSARETLADYRNPTGAHRVRFIRRDADGRPEQHEWIEDVVFVQSGEGTLVVGRELLGRTGRGGEHTGTDISSGTRYQVAAGDVIHIPADTPHRYFTGRRARYVCPGPAPCIFRRAGLSR